MSANFVALTTTTPTLADAIACHLRQILKRSALEGEQVFTVLVGTLVEVQISQAASDWLLGVMRQSRQYQEMERLRQD